MFFVFFFFFKQKTAYEMSIGDWSSDVCSSDLGRADQQDVDARDRGDGIEVLQRLVRLDHRHDNEPVVHGVEVIAVILELAPLAAHPSVAAVAKRMIAAGAHGGLRLRSG